MDPHSPQESQRMPPADPLPGEGDAESAPEAATVALPAGSERDPPKDGAFVPGEVLLNRFRIVRRAGRGGMGEVYEAEDLELGRVALKTIRQSVAGGKGMLLRFKEEIQLARRVSGANVCRIYELFAAPSRDGRADIAFLTMEFLDGEMLADRLRAGALPWDEARRLALDICCGLAAIHDAGVLHRDLKSRNVMLVPRNGTLVAVLTDFGLALPMGPGVSGAERAHSEGVAGTPEYMAPEQFEGGDLTRASDIYALGVVMYEMVTGRQPYAAHTPLAAAVRRGRKPDLARAPQGWREIIFCCLEYDPARRYQSAEQVAAALRRAANPVKRVTHDAARLARRFRIGVLLAAVLLLSFTAWRTVARMRMHAPPAEAVRWYGLGVAALREATDVKAIHALEYAVSLDPKYAMAHARLAEAWSDLDFTGAADHEMLLAQSEAREQRMSAEDEKYLAATQATLTRDYSGAVRRYQEILDSSGVEQRPAALVDVGRAQEKAGNSAGAMKSYQDAAHLAPDTPAPFVHIGILESRMQHEAAAQAAFAKAEKIYTAEANAEGLAEVEYQQGYLANEQGRATEAKQHLETARQMAQQVGSVQLEIRALTQLSSEASDSRDQKDAADYAQKAIDMANANGLAAWSAAGWVRLGNTYLNSGDAAERPGAENAFQRALQIATGSEQRRVEAQANVGLANLRSEDHPEQATLYAQRALDYYKQYGFSEGTYMSSLLLARAQRDDGELAAALQSSQTLLQMARNSKSKAAIAYAEDLVGSVSMRQEEYPAALAMFREALDQSSSALQPFEATKCAEALIHLGEYDAAESMLAGAGKVGMTGSALLVREELLLSKEDYAAGLAYAESSMAGMDAGALRDGLAIGVALASAHLGKLSEAEPRMAEINPTRASEKAQWNLAEAQVELLASHYDKAHTAAEAAAAYFQPLHARESELLALAVDAKALALSGNKAEAATEANLGLDIIRQLQESWAPTQFQSFVSRPDIKDAMLQLRSSSGSQ